MKIPMSKITYQLDGEGVARSIVVEYSTFDMNNNLTSKVEILPDHLSEGQIIDEVSRKDADALARNIINNWLTGADA